MTTPLLPPDSYTSHRLEHATPEHLHLTARRTFIGPIPEGWLKSHRKQWWHGQQILRRRRGSGGGDGAGFEAAVARPVDMNAGVGAGLTTTTAAHWGKSRKNNRSLNDGPGEGGDGGRAVESGAVQSEEGPRPSSQSADTQGAATMTSTTSLLHEQRSEGGAMAGGSAQNIVGDGGDVYATDERPGRLPRTDSSRLVRAANKLPTSRVHFTESTRFQLRARAQRLAARGNLRNSKVKDGEVLKVDRMLVRMDITQQNLGADFDERASQGVETKSLDKWREYMVVCRKHVEGDAQSILQLYQTRVIAARSVNEDKTKTKAKAQILLAPSIAKVNLFSSLDKTLCVWTRDNARTKIYYLRPRTGATSVEWYTFLRAALGSKRAQSIQVNVPDLSVSLRLEDPFRTMQATKLLAAAADGDDDALARAASDEKGAAGAIVARCIEMLQQNSEWADILKAWSLHDRIGLAWKRYDRLEWIHGAVEQKMYGTIAMQRTHDLELRPKDHYPLTVKAPRTEPKKGLLEALPRLHEPSPVEGFLIRLTSQTGQVRRMGKMMFKRLYFSSHNHFLLFASPAQATPPPPPKFAATANGDVPSSREIVEQTPLSYAIDPYPLSEDGKHVQWLEDDTSSARRSAFDQEAEAEATRNADMILNCDGFINLVDVVRVRKMHRGAQPVDEELDDGSDIDFHHESTAEQIGREDGHTSEIDEHRILELVMKNGLVIRLQAYNRAARKEWIRRLRELVTYWQARVKEDVAVLKSVRQQNTEALHIDERTEAQAGAFAYKWEVSQSFASPVMYHMCGIAQCRTIHLSGPLFRKPRRHTTFARCHVILSNGHLLVFEDTLRARSGRKLVHIHHERIASMSLKDCYLYSGLLTETDLLYQNQTFDNNMPGHHALPRVYLEDGWTSSDEDAATSFVLWHAKSKSWFRSSQYVDDVRQSESQAARDAKAQAKKDSGAFFGQGRTKKKLTRVSQLGTTGRSVVFKARSRAERDQWVTAIQVEIERLAVEDARDVDDVRLVEGDA